MPANNKAGAERGSVKPVIFSSEGPALTDAETAFFSRENPLGYILFARNVETPEQVRQLTSDFRQAVGRSDAPVLVDQEGGRVQRLRAPHWFEAPSFGTLGALYRVNPQKGEKALRIAASLIADDLMDVGINVDCSPCLDLSLPQTSNVIGDRSFSGSCEDVSHLGSIVMDEFQQAGITPVIKHMPGHGRGTVDSHVELPVVTDALGALKAADFIPFQALKASPWGMTAHIVFKDIDPDWPATQSRAVIEDIIRGHIGFDGLLLTDDLNMQALEGSLKDRAARALAAGIDVILHCSGKLDEMKEIASVCGPLSAHTVQRIDRAQKALPSPRKPLTNREAQIAELNELLLLVED